MITAIERRALQGIVDSDYRDGNDPVGCSVWAWSANPFEDARTFSGAMASLVKKGLARSCGGQGNQATVSITAAGLEALNNQEPTMKLSTTQTMVLLAAAKRADGAVMPLPQNLKGGAAKKVLDALLQQGLVKETEHLVITDAGRKAVNYEPDATKSKTREGTKQAAMIDLLSRSSGATVDEIVEATGWQKHTVRGAMAGALKKRLGLTIKSEKIEGRGRVYSLA